MNSHLRLLLAHQALPRVRRASTFMEIAGYPHYENVCSNILAFYLDPAAEHGMGDLLLRAFLAILGEPDTVPQRPVTVEREYGIDERQRIDLVVTAPGLVLGIENKIRHWEANDLNHYSRTLDGLAVGHPVLKLILCPRIDPAQSPAAGGFVRRTYGHLWQEVRSRMGHHLANAPANWIIHLNEFMDTTLREAGETPEEKELADFFMEHHAQVELLLEDRQRLLNRIARTVRELEVFLSTHPESQFRLASRAVYQTYTLATHFHVGAARIGMDLVGGTRGWLLQLFSTKSAGSAVRDALKNSSPMAALFPSAVLENNSYYALRRWDPHVTRSELEEALLEGFAALNAAADTLGSEVSESPHQQAHTPVPKS